MYSFVNASNVKCSIAIKKTTFGALPFHLFDLALDFKYNPFQSWMSAFI
jgi:hypothetical protein